ncbi:uncharacterized protein EV154DRAFT_564987 [Mucor mucedo]|uniref:uncharacterized protein n=1 Tax=Mucor mucedo TaxID=29922 RepID=UPI00221F1EBD|nr:uncharacterized protein EV154DRAFT_564987 [Mucor mucedo]KAI7889760.1 hypothetical protein EV154DRAFT_564987 [Mucor mucedo]
MVLTSSSSYLNIVMYSDEHGETIVEGDEEDVVYEDETIFQIDDLASSSYDPSPSPEIKVRYYVPNNNTPCGLSQSVVVNDNDYLRSQKMRSLDSYEHTSNSTYSQSAPSSYHPYIHPCNSVCSSEKDSSMINHTEKTSTFQLQSTLSDTQSASTSVPTVSDSPLEASPVNTNIESSISTQPYPLATTKTDTLGTHVQNVDAGLSTPRYRSWVIDHRIPSGVHENSTLTWNKLATQQYGTNSNFIHSSDSTRDESAQYWEYLHRGYQNLDRLQSNPFIFENIIRRHSLIKVTGIDKNRVNYAKLIDHFYDCNIVFVRYFRSQRRAYIAYKDYDNMMRAVRKYDRTDLVMQKEEIEIEDDMYSKSVKPLSKQLQRRIVSKNDLCYPERHGIVQTRKYYREAQDLPAYDLTQSYKSKENSSVLARYHPKAVATGQHLKRVNLNKQHIYFLDKIFSRVGHASIYYIIMQPARPEDIVLSQQIQYWSIPPSRAVTLNFLFANAIEVNIIFNIPKSKRVFGHAIMKSEFMDISSMRANDLLGTPFYKDDDFVGWAEIINRKNWKNLCRLEWKNIGVRTARYASQLVNPWFYKYPVDRSGDCCIIEPTVGKRLLDALYDNI